MSVLGASTASAVTMVAASRVVAPVDGYVTHLDLRLGDHATANSAALALVDVRVLDHFVVGHGSMLSFAERGLI